MEIKDVVQLIEKLEKLGWAHRAHAHLRYWFRGQPKAGWPLAPKVYRSTFAPAGMTKKERFEKECRLNQDFRVMSAGLRRGGERAAELYFLQQHYGMPTRLLDWTNNPLAALYFACTGDNGAEDGEVFMMDVSKLPQPANKNIWGIASSGSEEIQDAIEVISSWDRDGATPKRIIAVRPDYLDRRISLQRGCFTLHGPSHRTLTPAQNSSLTSVKIASGSKQRILRQLTLLGVDHFSIFGDLENLAKRLIEAYPSSVETTS
jgi:FRG domain